MDSQSHNVRYVCMSKVMIGRQIIIVTGEGYYMILMVDRSVPSVKKKKE